MPSLESNSSVTIRCSGVGSESVVPVQSSFCMIIGSLYDLANSNSNSEAEQLLEQIKKRSSEAEQFNEIRQINITAQSVLKCIGLGNVIHDPHEFQSTLAILGTQNHAEKDGTSMIWDYAPKLPENIQEDDTHGQCPVCVGFNYAKIILNNSALSPEQKNEIVHKIAGALITALVLYDSKDEKFDEHIKKEIYSVVNA